MEEILLELIGITYNQIESGVYALILQEVGSSRRIPIIIGYAEAQTIECRLQNVTPPRPLTHDMAASLLEAAGAKLTKVLIRRLSNGVFAAYMTVDSPMGRSTIDARSSDAIALAIRTDTPIYTTRDVLDEAGFDYAPGSGRHKSVSSETAGQGSVRDALRQAAGRQRTRADIEEAMRIASENEDYEEAARLKRELDDLSESE